jgi:hyperosmotically inducible protein
MVMLGRLLRAVFWIVLLMAVLAGLGAYFLGHRTGGGDSEPATGTTGSAATTARERGAEIGERIGTAADRAGDALSDGAITAKIKSKMALDDTLKASAIHVSTKDKVVMLTGRVAAASERERAVQLARETDGVKSVTDRLQMVR